MAGKKFASWGVAFCLLFAGLTWQWQAQAVVTPLDQPDWSALTSEQKTILAPLASEWKEMEPFRRKKWLGIAQRYPDMSEDDQAGVQRNMREWAKLAPNERKSAREKFKTLQKFPAEERRAVKLKWEEYSSLPQEKRESLKKEAAKRPTPVKTPAKPPVANSGTHPVAHTRASSAALPTATSMNTPRSPLSPLKPPQSPLVVTKTALPKTHAVPAADIPCDEE
jgi:hypothetical protein